MYYLNLLSNSILQVLLFTLIPFLWWVINTDKKVKFKEWIGLTKPVVANMKKFMLVFIGVLGLMPLFLLIPIVFSPDSSDLATAQFIDRGRAALFAAFIYGFLQTGLSEEILFRGFITKRLINKYGFSKGNNIQALLFGAVHGVLFFALYSWMWVLLIIAMTALTGWLMGYMNERLSSGSIISSWMVHGTANTLMAFLAAIGILG